MLSEGAGDESANRDNGDSGAERPVGPGHDQHEADQGHCHGDGESIYGAERATVEWINFSPLSCAATAKGNTLYWHIGRWYGSDLWIGGLKTRVLGARILSTGQAVKFRQTFESAGATDRLHLYDLPAAAPDPDLTVLALECDGKPVQQLGAGCLWMPEVP